MKRVITSLFLLGMLGASLFGQALLQKVDAPAKNAQDYMEAFDENRPSTNREVICAEDRILYPFAKLRGTTINLLTVRTGGFAFSGSQVYQMPAGASTTLNGFIFEARYDFSGTNADVPVNAHVYNVSAARIPVGAPIATTQVTVDTTGPSSDLFFVSFSPPVNITQDFALVV